MLGPRDVRYSLRCFCPAAGPLPGPRRAPAEPPPLRRFAVLPSGAKRSRFPFPLLASRLPILLSSPFALLSFILSLLLSSLLPCDGY
jgi:hypothetical protein